MRRILLSLAVAFMGVFLFCGSTCRRTPAPVAIVPKPDGAPVVAGQLGKDATIIAQAGIIDGVVAGTAQEPAVIAATAAQRQAVAAAPAVDVQRLVQSYEATIKSYKDAAARDAGIIADLREQLTKALSYVDRLFRIGLLTAGAACIAAGVLSFFLAAQVASLFPGLGPRLSIGIIATGVALIGVSFAYGWALAHQNLLIGIFAAAATGLGALYYANHHHAAASKATA